MAKVQARAILHIKRDLLLEATEDVYRFWSLVEDVRDAFSEDEVRDMILDIVSSLLKEELVYAADLDAERGEFTRWSLNAKESLDRIKSRWSPSVDLAEIDEVAWFIATPKGDAWTERYYELLSELSGS